MKLINSLKLCLCFGLILSLLTACGGNSSDNGGNPQEQKDPELGSISLTISDAITARLLEPLLTEVKYYDIYGTGPNEGTFEKLDVSIDTATVELTDLASGEWTIRVVAKDRVKSSVLGGGEVTVVVERGAVTSALVEIKPHTEPGTLKLTFNWIKEYLTNPRVEFDLVDSDNQTATFETQLHPDGNSAGYAGEQDAGYYTMHVRLFDGEVQVSGYTEVVRVMTGLTTYGTHDFDQVLEPIGDLKLSFVQNMNHAIDITVTADQYSLRAGESTTLTATLNETVENPQYTWYRNGQLQSETTNTYLLQSDSKRVDYVTVVVKSAEGGRIGDAIHRVVTSNYKFALKAAFGTGWAYSSDMADMDADGDLDFILAGFNGASTIYYNVDGEFSTENTRQLGSFMDVDAKDFNADGRMDLLASTIGGKVMLYYQQEDGSLVDSGEQFALESGELRDVLAEDLNGDGELDVVVTGLYHIGVRVYLKTAGGYLYSGQKFAEGNLDSGGVESGDLDGDGDMDLVIANYWNEPNYVLMNDGTGVFVKTQEVSSANTRDVRLADLNGDGHLDLLTSGEGVYLNDGSGHFSKGWSFQKPEGLDLVVADVNGDRHPDILQTHQYGSRLYLNKGDGTATFKDALFRFEGGAHFTAQVADFDGDGDKDIIFGNRNQELLQIFDAQNLD